jgi:hypothetical protein
MCNQLRRILDGIIPAYMKYYPEICLQKMSKTTRINSVSSEILNKYCWNVAEHIPFLSGYLV